MLLARQPAEPRLRLPSPSGGTLASQYGAWPSSLVSSEPNVEEHLAFSL